MKYAEKECHDCLGIFPGNTIRRYNLSKVSGTSRTQISGSSYDRTRTNVKYADIFLCTNCFSKRRKRDFLKSVLFFSFVALVVLILYVAASKSSSRRTATVADSSEAVRNSDKRSEVIDQASGPEVLVQKSIQPKSEETMSNEADTIESPTSPSTDTAAADSEEYPDDCSIIIRGEQKGGTKCLADSNGRNTFFLNNESGQVQYYPELPDKKVWQATWNPSEGDHEDLGSLRRVGKCLKNEIATIC